MTADFVAHNDKIQQIQASDLSPQHADKNPEVQKTQVAHPYPEVWPQRTKYLGSRVENAPKGKQNLLTGTLIPS